jgi:hypothetical protein
MDTNPHLYSVGPQVQLSITNKTFFSEENVPCTMQMDSLADTEWQVYSLSGWLKTTKPAPDYA